MRIIPSQGARIRSHAALPRMAFLFYNHRCHPDVAHDDAGLRRTTSDVARSKMIEPKKPASHNARKRRSRIPARFTSPGQLHPDIRVPFREISLAPTKTMSGEIEVNEPVRVYDTSGPWGDADQHVDVDQGLPALRAKWIRDRGDVEEIEGRPVTPHRRWLPLREARRFCRAETSNVQRPNVQRPTGNGTQRQRARQLSAIRNPQSATRRKPLRAPHRPRRHAAVVRSRRHRHARDGIHRDPRERPTSRRDS